MAVVAIFAIAGGIAYAAIPDAGTGVYHACMLKNIGTIRIIDPDKQHCSASLETEITFNQRGPKGDQGIQGMQGPPGAPGRDGANGTSPTVAQLASGDSHCPAGGAAITDAVGTTAYVCSSQNGQAGADGAPFAGTFTSPNGLYSISVADTGVTVLGPGASIGVAGSEFTVQSNDVLIQSGHSFLLDSALGIDVRAASAVTMQSGSNFSVQSGSNLLLKSGGTSTVEPSVSGEAPSASTAARRAGPQPERATPSTPRPTRSAAARRRSASAAESLRG